MGREGAPRRLAQLLAIHNMAQIAAGEGERSAAHMII